MYRCYSFFSIRRGHQHHPLTKTQAHRLRTRTLVIHGMGWLQGSWRLEWAPIITHTHIWVRFDTTKVENTVSALKGRRIWEAGEGIFIYLFHYHDDHLLLNCAFCIHHPHQYDNYTTIIKVKVAKEASKTPRHTPSSCACVGCSIESIY